MMDLRRTEAVNVDLREPRFDVGQQLFVPFQRQLGVQAPLHQDLVAAEGHRLFDLLVQHVARQDVDFFVPGWPIKRTEIADRGTLVRVVDVAIDVVRAEGLRMETPGDGVGRTAQRDQIVRIRSTAALLRGSAGPRRRTFQAVAQSRKTRSAPPGARFPAGPTTRKTISVRSSRPARGENAGSWSDSCMPSPRRFQASETPGGRFPPPVRCPNREHGPSASSTWPKSVPPLAAHTANTKGSPLQRSHSSPRSHVAANVSARLVHGPVADHQDGIGPRGVGIMLERERLQSRTDAEPLLQHDLHQGGARPGTDVESERLDFSHRHAAIELDAHHGTVRCHTGV